MKLLYRGIQHPYYLPTLEVTEAEIYGHYREVSDRRPVLLVPPVPQPSYDVICRGALYTTGDRAGQITVGRVAIAPPLAASPVRPVVVTSALLSNLAQVHDRYLRQNLERRLQSAQNRGDQCLVDLLEAERRQLA